MQDRVEDKSKEQIAEPITLRNLLDHTLREFMEMENVEDIDINKPQEVWIQRIGSEWERYERPHLTLPRLRDIAHEVATSMRSEFMEDYEPLSTKLSDGSRIEVVMLPSVVSGIALAIRKRMERYYTLHNFSFTDEEVQFIRSEVENGKTFLISGGTSSGKTTAMENMCDFIPVKTRIINVQHPLEIEFLQPNRIDWEVKGNSFDEIYRNLSLFAYTAMRLNPDIIIYGEIREKIMAASFAQVINTGHEGSMATIHADGPEEALERLSKFVHQQEGGSLDYIHESLSKKIDYVLHLKKNKEGQRVGELQAI